MGRQPWVLLVSALLASACQLSPAPAQSQGPPNILVVYVDDLGWADIGVQGSAFYETPHIDRLAASGLRFTNAYANAPNCAPSRAALLSGTYAPRTGIYTVSSAARGDAALRKLIPVENQTTLDLEVVTLAEVLRDAGYATGFAGKWHLGGEGHLPTDQGFDWAVAGDHTGTPRAYFYPYRREGGPSIPGLEAGAEDEYLPDRLTDEAIHFVTENSDGPFFMFLSHYSVHTPIVAKPQVAAKYAAKIARRSEADGDAQPPLDPVYAAMIESVDDSVGRLLATLEGLGIADNTVVVFFADNGGYGPVTSMAPLRGSKGMLYEGGIREPLIIRWPSHTVPGATTDVPVIGTDFFPTLVEITEATLPPGKQLDGLSFAGLLSQERPKVQTTAESLRNRPLFWHFPAYLQRDASVKGPWRTTPASAIRQGDFKLIHFFEESRSELYNLRTDIGESIDLAESDPDRAAALENTLREWWAATGAFLPSEPNPLYVTSR